MAEKDCDRQMVVDPWPMGQSDPLTGQYLMKHKGKRFVVDRNDLDLIRNHGSDDGGSVVTDWNGDCRQLVDSVEMDFVDVAAAAAADGLIFVETVHLLHCNGY